MLGHDVVAELHRRSLPVLPLTRAQCDVTDAAQCESAIVGIGANVVINCTAYTNVNGAESEADAAMAINAYGAENLAAACRRAGARLIHVSTDYVYDGTKSEPYEATDQTNPLNSYGRSKLAGEHRIAAVLPADCWAVVRTAWLYGAQGNNFVKTMLRLGREGKDLNVINDQVGSPTYTVDLATTLVELALRNASGIIHATGSGECTWYEFAEEIFRLSGVKPASLKPCSSVEFPTPAVRPANSRLSPGSLVAAGVPRLPHWKDALERYLAETGELKP